MSVTVSPAAATISIAASVTVDILQAVRVSKVLAIAELTGASVRVSKALAVAELVPNTLIAPAAAVLTFAAQEPSVNNGLELTPSAASITTAASGPGVVLGATSSTPSAASITTAASGPTVTIGTLIAPAAATITTAPSGPTVVLGSMTVTPAAAVMETPTTTPKVLANATLAPAAAAITTAASGPTVVSGHTITPPAAALSFSVPAPVVYSGAVRVSQVVAVAELSGARLEVSQVVAVAELANAQIRVSQVVIVVELVEPPPARAGQHRWAGRTTPVKPAQYETVKTWTARAAIQAGLAAARASIAPTTLLRTGGGAGNMATAAVRTVTVTVAVDWERDGNWLDATADLISYRGSQSLVPPNQTLAGGTGTTDRATVILNNNARKYSTRNTTSVLYSAIANGAFVQAPVKIGVQIDLATTYIFTGVLRNMTEQAATPSTPATVTLDVRSKDDLLLQKRLTTTAADWAAVQASQYTEDWHIIDLLEQAGWVDGTDFRSQTWADANPGDLRTIDPGLFPIPYVWLDAESVLSKIWQIAGACGGWFYVDGNGLAHYHNMGGLLSAMLEQQFGAVAAYAVDTDNVGGLTLNYSDADLYSEITVEATPRSAGEAAILWQPDNPLVVQPNDTITVWATLGNPATEYTAVDWTATTAGGLDITADVTVTPTYYAKRVKLVIANGNATSAAYIGNLKIRGVELTEDETIEATVTTDNVAFWDGTREDRIRAIRGNVNIQTESHARTLATYLSDRAEQPQLLATVLRVDDPGVTIGRLVEIDYDDTVDDTISGVVVGVDWAGDNTGLRWDVRVMELAGPWTAASPYFVIGTNKLGSSGGAGEAFIFY